ncbi:MAG: hypothetical protein JJU00_17470 [Opitutales bacterium]|nr:hypothetical protein [Opitutales bacterium]
MKVTRIYADASGVTRFEDREIPLQAAGEIGRLSETMPGRGLIFRETEDTYDFDWHPAPRRQWIVLLDGEIEIEAGDGEVRCFRGGDVLQLEDTEGRGHRTRQLSAGVRRSLFIPF